MDVNTVILSGSDQRENVMNTDRITMTTQSLEKLLKFATQNSIPYTSLRSDKILNKLRELKNNRDFYGRFRRVLNDINRTSNFIDDAIFAISGDLQGKTYYTRSFKPFAELGNPYGHSISNYGAIEMNTLVSLAYYIICHSEEYRLGNGNVKEILLDSFIRNIGECVEDDGHLVCNWGKTQRILNTFQGYIPGIHITASLHVESPDKFQQRVTSIIREYINGLDDDNPLKLIICCQPIPNTVDLDDVKMAYRRIIDGWKDHASAIYDGSQLSEINNYLDRLSSSYLQMVDDAEIEPNNGPSHGQASFILNINTAMPNGGKSNCRVERETEWQEKLGDFKDELNSTRNYISKFLNEANEKISNLNQQHRNKESETETAFSSGNEQKIDAAIRMIVRIQESINYYNEVKEIWENLNNIFLRVEESTMNLYNNQPKFKLYRNLISIKDILDSSINLIMGIKLDYNEIYINRSQEYACRAAKVEELIKNFETGQKNNSVKNIQIEYDNLIRVTIRAQEDVDLSLAILRPVERVIDLLKHVKSKLMLIFPQQW